MTRNVRRTAKWVGGNVGGGGGGETYALEFCKWVLEILTPVGWGRRNTSPRWVRAITGAQEST